MSKSCVIVNLVNLSECRLTPLGVSDLVLERFNCTGRSVQHTPGSAVIDWLKGESKPNPSFPLPDFGCTVTSWCMVLLSWLLLWRTTPNGHCFPYIAFVRHLVPQTRKVTNRGCTVAHLVWIFAWYRWGMGFIETECSAVAFDMWVAGWTACFCLRTVGFKKERPCDSRLIQFDLPSFMCWSDSTPYREWGMVSRDPSVHPLWLNVRPKEKGWYESVREACIVERILCRVLESPGVFSEGMKCKQRFLLPHTGDQLLAFFF